MTNSKKNRFGVPKIKKYPITTGNAKGVSTRELSYSFCVQSRIEPVFFENILLFCKKFSCVRGQFFEIADKITRFVDSHKTKVYFGGKDFSALRYESLTSSLFLYPPKLSSGIKRTSFLNWSFISLSSFARRSRTAVFVPFAIYLYTNRKPGIVNTHWGCSETAAARISYINDQRSRLERSQKEKAPDGDGTP